MRVLEILSHRCLDGRPLLEPGVREIGTGTAAGPYHGDQTQLSPGLTALGKGNPAAMFSRCGNRLGGAWAFSLEEGRAWLESLLVSAPGSKTGADLSDLVSTSCLQAVHTGMRALIYNSSAGGSQAEQSGMRTYYFSADTQEDMNAWVRAMNQAAQVLSRSSLKRSVPWKVPVRVLHTH